MVKLTVAFDNNDFALGNYFELSRLDIIHFITGLPTDIEVHNIHGGRLNQAYIETYIPQINGSRFIFLAYSHGQHNCLTQNGVYYIKKNENSHLFVNSFFYSMCCLSAKELGEDITNNHGGMVFIGYDDEALALPGAYTQISIECDNYGMKMFLKGHTAAESIRLMKANYRQQIDDLESQGDILHAGYLEKNLAMLVMHGNGDLTIQDFII